MTHCLHARLRNTNSQTCEEDVTSTFLAIVYFGTAVAGRAAIMAVVLQSVVFQHLVSKEGSCHRIIR